MIGFRNRPTGRFGNHLFQYYFLNKIANHLKSQTFHTKFLGSELFEGFGPKWINYAESMLRPTQNIDYHSCAEMTWSDFLNNAVEIQKNGRAIVLPTGRLDWFFYDNQPENASEIIKFHRKVNYKKNNNQKTIAVHFRGGDFVSLRPEMVLPQKYYQEAIEYLKEDGTLDHSKIVMYTDDPAHQTVRNLVKQYDIDLNQDKDYINAFNKIIESDVLIASSSTFSYWAGVLGRKKRVIHSKDWINDEINRGDNFWIPVRNKSCNFLRDFVEI